MAAELHSFSAETLNEIIDAVPNAMLVKDERHRWILVNETLCREMGRSRSELLNRTDFDLLTAEQAEKNWVSDNLVLASGEPHETEVDYPRLDGGGRTVVVRKRRLFLPGENGISVPAVVVVIVDVTRFRLAERHARILALSDPLTGMPNRLLFGQRLEEALEKGRRNLERFALFVLDLDGFKEINDRWGHAAGDRVLRVVGDRLVSTMREIDTVARLGGDEFGVIQQSDDQPSASIFLAERLVRVLTHQMDVCDRRMELSASIGVSIFPEHGRDAETLLRKADAALYSVKNGGKNGYAMFAWPDVGTDRSRQAVPEI